MSIVCFDNVVFDLQKSGGISVVWYELLRKVQSCSLDIRYLDSGFSQNNYRSQLEIPQEKVNSPLRKVPLCIDRYLPQRIDFGKPFIFHSSYYRYCVSPNAINITTVHDFTYEKYATGIKQKVHSWQKRSAVLNSDYIVCISKNTRRDLLQYIKGVDESKVGVIYNGVSEDYYVLEDNSSNNIPFGKESYLLFVGGRQQYKNFKLAVKAVAATKYNLVIVGAKLNDEERKFVETFLSPNRYRCMGFISNKELNILYNNAAALVYPSVYEGFGIPVVEAQKAGCPVIAFNSSSIPEVIGYKQLLVNELTVNDLISKISLLTNNDLVSQIKEAGLLHASQFSWDKMSSEYLKLYAALLAEKDYHASDSNNCIL